MKGKGYVASLLGALIGGTAFGAIVGWTAATIEMRANPDDGWAGLAGAVIGGAVGLVVGSGSGTWVALRVSRQIRAGVTAIIVAVVSGPAAVGGLALSSWGAVGPVNLLLAPAAFLAAVAGARAIALKTARNDAWAEPPGPDTVRP